MPNMALLYNFGLGPPCCDSKLSVLRSVTLGTSSELSGFLKSGRNFENLPYNFKVSFIKHRNFHCRSIIWTFQTKTYKPLDVRLRLYLFQFSMDLIKVSWFWWSFHPLFPPYLAEHLFKVIVKEITSKSEEAFKKVKDNAKQAKKQKEKIDTS